MRTLPLFSSVAQVPIGELGSDSGSAATGAGCRSAATGAGGRSVGTTRIGAGAGGATSAGAGGAGGVTATTVVAGGAGAAGTGSEAGARSGLDAKFSSSLLRLDLLAPLKPGRPGPEARSSSLK